MNKRTKKHFENSYERLKIARQVYLSTKKDGNPDYSYIVKAEPGIRDNHLKMLYEKASEFGHTEVQRQKNSDATVGPINQRLNACGAALREFSECNFPFPEPESFGTRTRRERSNNKKFRIAGYKGTTFGPQVILVHPDLPSLDFGDAVRSHNEIIATECAIRNVSVRETTRYSNLFLLLARPYLERIYSENKYGQSGFRSGVNKTLRRVKELITEAGYRPQMYIKRSVTGTLDYNAPSKVSLEFFDDQIEEASIFYGKHPFLQELKRLRYEGFETSPGETEPCLTTNDVKHIRQKAIGRGQLKGSILHRRIEHLFPTPWSLRDVIYNEHEYLGSSDDVIVSELPLQTSLGKGKADLTLFERVLTKDGKRALQRPSFVCEIKTRMGHEWYLNSELKISQSRGRDGIPHRVVAEFPMNDRPMDDWEWKSVVDSSPHQRAKKQVAIYADALAQGFQEITGERSKHVYRATIMIDAISDINQIRSIIEPLVTKSYEFLKKNKGDIERTIVIPSDSDCNIALVIHKQDVSTKIGEERIDIPWHPSYNPFQPIVDSERRFIIYLTGKSPTSAGTSAAWNAKYYHGLKLLYEMRENIPETKFLWLDLAGQFHEPKLAEARLRLRPRSFKEKDEAMAHHTHIREFFETFKVKDYLDSILSYLYEKGPEPSFDIENTPDSPLTIIISGIDELRDATPETHREHLHLMLDRLLTSLPDNECTTVLCFDSPVPSVDKSIPYATRALLPYYSSSTLAEYTTEIIWNLPSPPRSAVYPERSTLGIIGDSPMYDDIRLIIKHTPKELDIQFESIPLLQGWSSRFRNQGRGLIVRERKVTEVIPEKITRDRIKLLSLTMIPWIVNLHPEFKNLCEPDKKLREQFDEIVQEIKGVHETLKVSMTSTDEPPGSPPSTLDLLRFRQPSFRSGKSFVPMTEGSINSQRLYRSPLKLLTTPRHYQITADSLIQDEKLDAEWLYGIKLVAGQGPHQPWWMVLQDPKKPSRMLVGCFLNKRIKEDEFHWSETKKEILTHSSIDEIHGYERLVMRYKITEQGAEVWNDEGGFEGILELKSQGYSSVSHLRATKFIQETPSDTGSQPDVSFPASIHQRIFDALKRYIEKLASPIPVKVKIERTDDACIVTFSDANDDVLQDVELESLPDLISLLRWPWIHGGPMYTDADQFVTWNVFEDIEYSDLDLLRPYIIYRTTRTAPKELPKRISQFYGPSEEVIVEIEHDKSVCPLAQEKGTEHGECWQILLHERAPVSLKSQLESHMTGRMVHGFLASGRIWSKKLYEPIIVFNYKVGTADCLAFQEDDWIRRVLRERRLVNLPSIPPGSYLRAKEEKWIVDILIDNRGVNWNATSTVTERRFARYTQTFKLDFTNKLETEHNRILEIITKNLEITIVEIKELAKIENHLTEMLEEWGFGELSPPCDLFVELLASSYSLILKLKNPDIDYEILKETYQIDRNTPWEIIDEKFTDYFNEELLLQFNIVNRVDVVEQFNKVQELLESSDEDEQDDIEEPDEGDLALLKVISEYRDEVIDKPGNIQYMCHVLLQLAIQRIDEREFDKAIAPLEEATNLLLECNMNNSTVRNDLRTGFLLITKYYSKWPDNASRLLKTAQRKFKLLIGDKFLVNIIQELYDLIESLIQKVEV